MKIKLFFIPTLILILTFCGRGFAANVEAQQVHEKNTEATVTVLATETTAGESFTITVWANNIYDMAGFQWTIAYDESQVSYLGHSNWAEGIGTVSTNSNLEGKVAFLYSSLSSVDIPDGVFFELNFEAKLSAGGSTQIEWTNVPTKCEIHNSVPQVIPVNWQAGIVTINPIYKEVNASVSPTNTGLINNINPFQQTYQYGSLVQLEAQPILSHTFKNWTENGFIVSDNAHYSFEITQDRTIVANFEDKVIEVSLVIVPDNSGTVSGAGSYVYGETVSISANPNEGYEFLSWTEADTLVSVNSDYSFTVETNRNIQANFQLKTYTIDAVVQPENSGIVQGAGTYLHGELAELTAVPETGYDFTGWTESDTLFSENSTISFAVSDNRNFTATFQLQSFDILVTVDPVGAGLIDGQGTYYHGETVSLTATPHEQYEFLEWRENSEHISSNQVYSFQATNERNLYAVFKIKTFEITANTFPESSGTITGAGVYEYGQVAELIAQPEIGYDFINWTEGGVQVSENLIYSFEVYENLELTANFQLQSFEISSSAQPPNGGITTGNGVYNYGDTAELVAVPAENFSFYNWTEDAQIVSTLSSYSFKVVQDRQPVANFTRDYVVNAYIYPETGGTVTGAGIYSEGETVTLLAEPAIGHTFSHWAENSETISEETELVFIIEGNRDFTAVFTPDVYTVEYHAAENGYIEGESIQQVEHGADALEVTAAPNTGYHFVAWSDDNDSESRIDKNITGDLFLTAFFEINTYSITASASPDAAGSTQGSGYYQHGQIAHLSAVPDDTYLFVSWTEGETLISTEADYSFEVISNRSLIANFQLKTYDISVSAQPQEGGQIFGGGEYFYGEMVTVGAEPAEGYNFVAWLENSDTLSLDNTMQFEAFEHREIFALFELKTYEIVLVSQPDTAGAVYGSGLYQHGESAEIYADPDNAYDFVNWTENGEVFSVAPLYNFTVTEDKTIQANFQLKTLYVTASENPENSAIISGVGFYKYGDTVLVNAEPAIGYDFMSWTEFGVQVSKDPEYSFIITGNRSLTANLKLQIHEVNALVSPENTGIIQGTGTYRYGELAELTAIPADGYAFCNWTEDDEIISDAPSYSFTVDKDRNLIANFRQQAELSIQKSAGVAGDTISVIVTASDIYDLTGFQWTIEFDSEKLSFLAAINWHDDIIEDALILNSAYEGKLTFAYSNLKSVNIQNDVFFNLQFELGSRAEGEAYIRWSDDPTVRELSDSEPQIIPAAWNSGSAMIELPLLVEPTASTFEICEGDRTRLFANAMGGTGNYTYYWTSSPEGFISESRSPLVAPVKNTTYYITVNDGLNEVSDSLYIAMRQPPKIIVQPSDIVVSISEPAAFTVYALGENLWYQWLKDGVPIQDTDFIYGANDANLFIFEVSSSDEGFYKVIVSDDCSESSSETAELSITSSAAETIARGLSVFPNPVEDRLTIHTNYEIQVCEIVSITGSVVYKIHSLEKGKSTLDISFLNSGMYVLNLYSNDAIHTFKLLKN